MDTDAASLIWFVVPSFVVPAALVVKAFRSPSGPQLQRWADGAGVVVTPANEVEVRERLGRARRFRAVAAFPFWWLALVRTLDADFPEALATPYIALAAYVLGAIVAELTWRPADTGAVRQAALLRRSADDYEPGWIRALPWLLLSMSAFALVVAPQSDHPAATTGEVAAALVAALAFILLGEFAVRRITARPQPGGDLDLLAADDALRATGIALARGGAILGGLHLLSVALEVLLPEPSGWLLLVWFPLGALEGSMTGVTLLVLIGQGTWAHRRRFRQSATAAAPTAPTAPAAGNAS